MESENDTTSNDINPIEWFRQASPYLKAYRGKTFVLSVPDRLLSSAALSNLTHDLTLLDHLGIRLVLCFGLRSQINAELARSQSRSVFKEGRRVTDDDALAAILTAAGLARVEFEARFSMGLPNTAMAGAHVSISSGNFVNARPYGVHDGVDFQHTGTVREIQIAPINALLDAGHLVLLPPLGYSLTGEVFNLPSEEIALQTAVSLGADKLILFVDDLPVNEDGEPVRHDSANRMEQLGPKQTDDMLSRTISTAVSACRQGVGRVHLLPQHDGNGLLTELFTREGSGTLVTAEPWETVRSASIEDVGGIIELIEPLQQDGTLATRSREQLELDIGQFLVCERESMIVACAAINIDTHDNEKLAEVFCVVTHPEYRGGGRADRLLRTLENQAREAQCQRLILLSTRTGHWFIERGFVEADASELPNTKRNTYNAERNSKVYIKSLEA
ncbi:MAG: amino-acid N-acetyltransferase [Gammaproteobacteria bacterium]|nr:amino-acid N-acetyltransferase [Gammaproteobacteria bacterium]